MESINHKSKKVKSMKLNQLQNKNLKLYFIFCYGLVGGGKSTLCYFFEEMIKSKDFNDKFKYITISSDKIKADLIADYTSKNSNNNFQEVLDKINLKAKNGFNTLVINKLKNEVESSKINLFFVDKLFSPGKLNEFHQFLANKLKNKTVQFYIFVPNSEFNIELTQSFFPFSWSYILQCHYRLRGRKNHETLDYDKNPKAYLFIILVLNLFKNQKFTNTDKFKYYQLSFYQEKKISIDSQILQVFSRIYDCSDKDKFDINYLLNFDQDIVNFLISLEELYPENYFQSTIELLKQEIKIFLFEEILSKAEC